MLKVLQRERPDFFEKFGSADPEAGAAGEEDANEEEPNMILIQASSAGYDCGNFAKIMINNELVEVDAFEDVEFRGLHIVMIDPSTGKVLSSQVFDTYKTSENINSFIKDIKEESKGHIVVVACKDECVTSMSKECK